jgi:serine/threonine protein kinase
MGNSNFRTSELDISQFQGNGIRCINLPAVSKSNFIYHFCIGKGGFGKVWRVERKKEKNYYAMKEMSKARIITKRSVKSVINERQILEQLNNTFIVNMYYAF